MSGSTKVSDKRPKGYSSAAYKKISEIDYCPQLIDIKLAVNNVVRKRKNLIIEEENKSTREITNILLTNLKITTRQPDNIVQLKNNEFFRVYQIQKTDETVIIAGYKIKCEGDSFNYPCESSKIGVWKLGVENTKIQIVAVNEIKHKCIVLQIKEEKHAFQFLHIE